MKSTLIVFLFFLFTGSSGIAQSGESKEIKGVGPGNFNSTTLVTVSGDAVKSPYFGFDNRIKEICVGENIPEKFPTREGYADRETYRRIANEWLKAHSAFVKPEFIQTLIEK